MDYYYTKLEKKPIKSKNNLFVSKLYKNKILSEKHKLKKNFKFLKKLSAEKKSFSSVIIDEKQCKLQS